jgi:eukaryotic-like serine/threonine-protein kinase
MQIAREDWPELLRRLDTLLEQPDAQHATALIEDTPPRLRAALQQLLAQRGAIDRAGFMSGLKPLADDAPAAPAEGERIGPWRVLQELGRGGMSTVVLAERADGAYQRRVALKLPELRPLRGAAIGERFARERNILAALSHPGIAMMIDAGIDGRTGQPWLAMEYVDGRPITEHAAALPLAARVRLFQQVLAAVQHAHAQLVIHRDIKPANVLVDREGRVKLLDFGVAKLLEGEGASSDLTQWAGAAMTPQYASPEQVAGRPLGTASDVYSLGVLLFELLTGGRPYRLKRGTTAELEEAITQADVVVPSRSVPDRLLARRLRGDLDAVVMKALAAEPAQRYASAEAFARDLERWLAGRPVEARPARWAARTAKLVRRHAWAFGAAVALFVALAGGLAATLWQAHEARLEAKRANAVQAFLLDIFRRNSARQGDPEKARATTARELLDLGFTGLDQALADTPAAHRQVAQQLATIYSELGLIERAVELHQRSLALAERLHGPNSREALQGIVELASEMHHVGRLEERRALLQRGLKIAEGLGRAPSSERSGLYMELAQFEISTDIAAARRHADLGIAEAERLGDIRHLVSNLSIAGMVHEYAGDRPGAEAAYRRALDLADQHAGHETFFPSELLRTRVQLAEIQMHRLAVAEGEATLRTALAETRRVNGPSHVDTLQTAMRLGFMLQMVGRPREAVAVLEPLRPIIEANDAADEFNGPPVLNALALAYGQLGRNAEAAAALRRAIEVRDRHRAKTLFAATLRESLARVHAGAGATVPAREAIDAASALLDAVGAGPETANRQRIAETRSLVLLAAGDAEGAAQALPPGARPQVSAGGLNVELQRVEIDLLRGADEAALQRLQQLQGMLQRQRLDDALPLIEARRLLACGRWALRHAPARAQALLARSVALRQAQTGADSPLTTEAARWLARAAPGDAGARPAACEQAV